MTDRACAVIRCLVVSSEGSWILRALIQLQQIKRRRMAMNEVQSPTVLVSSEKEANGHIPHVPALASPENREDGEKELKGAVEQTSNWTRTPARFYPWPHDAPNPSGLPLCVSSALTRARGSNIFVTTNGLAAAPPENP